MASNNQGREAEDGDDDFADFGGFEAAEPVADMPATQAQAAASPWAMFNAGNASGQPDLLCAQNRFPNYLDPSGITGPGDGAGLNSNLNNHATGNPPDLPQADLLSGQLLGARIAENALDGALAAGGGGQGFHASHSHINGRLPDLGLGNNENRLFGQGNGPETAECSIDDQGPVNPAPFELLDSANGVSHPVRAGIMDPHATLQDGAVAEIHAGGERLVGDAMGGTAGASFEANQCPNLPEAEVHVARQDSERDNALQQRLAALTDENLRLENELSRYRDELATQRSRLQEVEARHQAQLEEVRSAGHDALAVVVEQYKEQSKTVVLEQQEETHRHIAEIVREQMQAFQDLLQTQRELQEQKKQEDEVELKQQIAQALEQSQREQEEKFQRFLSEEQEKQRKATEKALNEERLACQERMQESIAAEVERGRARLEEAKAEASDRLEEEKRRHETALSTVREEEKRLAQEQMAQLAREERERSRQMSREAVEASRLESQGYLQEQRQADSRVRQRHLASLDLFLESSRQQIALLMASELHQPLLRESSAATPQQAAASEASAGRGMEERLNGSDTNPHKKDAPDS
ncbi:coiled-coil domain-containing protein 91-like [Plakobranchus ocellatus]|uniref:Coiled-coil domain-containing protein 91-like n=1 Tax=Plakobranchus ocellatus TaxID=259542 RepID=A0AAV4C6Z5_9GAST|nr:coiled-coil domain-containing protein 91-like [Plakobranchus ocellatus]